MHHYTLTITEDDYAKLTAAVFEDETREGAAYLLCGRSNDGNETRFLVHDVLPVALEDYLLREWDQLSIASVSYARAAKRASARGDSIVFVHTHPEEFPDFSAQDDREESVLMDFFNARISGRVHGGLVLPRGSRPRGRVWTETGYQRMECIRVLGSRFQFFHETEGQEAEIPAFFDRQVRAFGPDLQRVLGRLHVGIVGAGGTGSAVLEQLTRLGVGTISVFDRDCFDRTNVNRVYGSGTADHDKPKVEIAEREIKHIGVGTTVHIYREHIPNKKPRCGCEVATLFSAARTRRHRAAFSCDWLSGT